ncbi:MAG: ABC transporter permease [Sneathiellales bacterium]|nr:ABC transporter permease [Sneathiellales bacterium]
MNELLAGIGDAFSLLIALDPDLLEISSLSLQVSLTAVLIAAVIGLPFGAWLSVSRFRYRRSAIAILNALMGLPPVVVGLIVYLLFSRSSPFGVFNLLFTPTAMIIAQTILVTPIIASLTHQTLRELWFQYHDLLISMNASKWQRMKTLLWEGRRGLLTASLTGFGRAIGEIGAIMIVGGNIDHLTRVLTTAIALEVGKGNFPLALGLGFILIAIAIFINMAVHILSKTEREGTW